MWKCKHCKEEFQYETTSEKANHSRWCDKNPKRNDTSNLVKGQEKRITEKLGSLKMFDVNCHNCDTQFEVEEREKQFPKKEKYFCSRTCSNSEGGKAKAQKLEDDGKIGYRALTERYHEQKCVVCGFDKIVEAHHVNEIHSDNRPENLVFLCPNHHKMFHSNYKDEIVPYIEKYINGEWDC